MSIQSELEIDKKGDIVELTGFADYGKEGILCHTVRVVTQEKRLVIMYSSFYFWVQVVFVFHLPFL